MVSENRIKTYGFTASQLTADASGNIGPLYSERPLNGEIKKIIYDRGTIATNGSLVLATSGAVAENIWTFLNASSDTVDYLHVSSVNNLRLGSAVAVTAKRVLGPDDGILCLWGSGCGATSGASALNIVYNN